MENHLTENHSIHRKMYIATFITDFCNYECFSNRDQFIAREKKNTQINDEMNSTFDDD